MFPIHSVHAARVSQSFRDDWLNRSSQCENVMASTELGPSDPVNFGAIWATISSVIWMGNGAGVLL